MPRQLKDAGQRRRYNQPVSEWVDLQPLDEPVLRPYPMDWYRPELRGQVVPKHIWDLWRTDPVTTQWSPADMATVLDLGERFYALRDADRLRVQTYLGLNAHGRRNLRWRNPTETASAEKANARAAEVRRLRIVAEREAREG